MPANKTNQLSVDYVTSDGARSTSSQDAVIFEDKKDAEICALNQPSEPQIVFIANTK